MMWPFIATGLETFYVFLMVKFSLIYYKLNSHLADIYYKQNKSEKKEKNYRNQNLKQHKKLFTKMACIISSSIKFGPNEITSKGTSRKVTHVYQENKNT
ncbi:MAG: hypothetical protein ATN32_07695 [Candidatus Epulonipiscium fishelsonii]|nr:MAG: hypothetical protein ATN32_07695 [Epulopiscium sp. AS2M-Bin002]